ncbi:hypothetical protein BJ944DRAFT_31444 [Cunninghamella echinulata]|nr:hypothetical protein BJ944DRAFT_31444 [Cunninghamella echinulata]
MNFNKEKKTGTILDFFKKSNTFKRNDNSTNNNCDNNGMQSPQAEKRTFYDLTEDDDFEDDLIMYEQKALSSSHFTQKNNMHCDNVGANGGNINASFQSTSYVKSSSGLVLPNKNKTIVNNNSQHSSSSSIQASHVIDMPSYNKFTLTNKHQYKKTLPQFSSQENDAIILDLEDSSSSNSNSMESTPIKHKIYPKFSKPINLPVYNPEKVINSYHIPEDYIPAASPTLQSRPSRDLPSSFKKASSLISESNPNPTSRHSFRHNSSTTFVKPNPYGSSRFGSSSSNKIMNNFFSAGSTVTPKSTFSNVSNHNSRFNNIPPSKKSRTYISSFKKNSQDDYAPTLSNEQQRVLSMVLNERKSLFFTGSAGNIHMECFMKGIM